MLVDADGGGGGASSGGGKLAGDPCVRMAPEKRRYLFGALRRDPQAPAEQESDEEEDDVVHLSDSGDEEGAE